MTDLPEEGTLEWELMQARAHASRALSFVYHETPPNRGLFWRLRLLKAESILMRLWLKEAANRRNG